MRTSPARAVSHSSWTAKLLADPDLLCRKVREEAGELCQTLERSEGQQRAISEMADLLYHSMVLLNVQVSVLCCSRHTQVCHITRATAAQLP